MFFIDPSRIANILTITDSAIEKEVSDGYS